MSNGETKGEKDGDEDSEMEVEKLVCCKGKVEGHQVTTLIDTGANRSLVHSSLFPEDTYTGLKRRLKHCIIPVSPQTLNGEADKLSTQQKNGPTLQSQERNYSTMRKEWCV